MTPCGHLELSSGLTHILAAFRETLDPSAKESDGLTRNVYNEDTCWEFHQLLLATLLSYGKALILLGKINDILQPNSTRRRKGRRISTMANLDDLMQQREEYTERAMLCGIVLWRLAYSGMLR
jgi:phosphopentomutase